MAEQLFWSNICYKEYKNLIFSVNMVRIACKRDLNIIIMDTVKQWNLSIPTCTGRDILCQNRQGVGLHSVKHI